MYNFAILVSVSTTNENAFVSAILPGHFRHRMLGMNDTVTIAELQILV